MTYLTVPLASTHDKAIFSCGKQMLDRYIQKLAGQDMKRRLAVVFILPEEAGKGADQIAKQPFKGYYSLSNDNIPYDQVPLDIQKKMPSSYTVLPTTLLGRLAVDQRFQGKGVGEQLLLDALKRSYDISASEIGSVAIVVDPLDRAAVSFYAQYGFVKLPDRGRMFLPMKTIGQLF